MLERELKKEFTEVVEKCDGVALKFVSPGNTDVPDWPVVLPGGCTGSVELE